ncbi:MAG: FAD-dependent oxidoreductase [Betaproteobacteria bacterium]
MHDSQLDLRRAGLKQRVLARPLASVTTILRGVRIAAWPFVDVIIRLWLAQVFFISGLLKAANWDNALDLAANEYPVSWMSPASAALLGVLIEVGGSVMLALGLGTRAAACAMLVLSLVIQFNYLAFDTHLLWVALFGWYVVNGAGAISLDRMLARGFNDSALPFAESLLHFAQLVTRWLRSPFLLVLRLWLVAAMLIAAGSAIAGFMAPESVALFFPLRSAAHVPAPLLLAGAWSLALGVGTRITSAILLLTLAAMQMMEPRLSEDVYWMLTFALLALNGPGALSIDAVIGRVAKRLFPQLDGKPAFALAGLPRVVIVGAGFGGLSCAARLARAQVRVTLIDRHNYHLFQPLLYQVATAGLSPGDIATPIRGLFRERFNTEVRFGEVTGIDKERQEVIVGAARIPYDYLVLATGATHSYFGREDWAPFAPGLKRIEDATEMRRRMLTAFELAEACDDEGERRSLLTFLIVGGGPTGVELAGAIAELARFGMEKEFRRFDPAHARVLLVQAGARILPTFPPALSEHARRSLERLGVEVLLDSRVERIDDTGVTVSGNRIASRTVMWAAGVVASPAARWLQAESDNAGRLKVADDLSVPGLGNVFALGDTALSLAWKGKPVPGLAPAAKQGGLYVARVIGARVEGRAVPAPFAYTHLGSLATIGRKAAVADFGWVRASGALAWWFWGAVHLGFLVGVRNRVSVMFDWFWAYLTYRGGTRLITGGRGNGETAVAQDARAVKAAA